MAFGAVFRRAFAKNTSNEIARIKRSVGEDDDDNEKNGRIGNILFVALVLFWRLEKKNRRCDKELTCDRETLL